MLLLTACGRVGDPLPPIRYKALVPENLTISQQGARIVLKFPRPSIQALERSKVARVEILRRSESADSPRRLTEEEFLDSARIVGSFTARELLEAKHARVEFQDRLDTDKLESATRLRYAIRYVQYNSTPLPLSSYSIIEPFATVAVAPTAVTASVSAESIHLKWQPPLTNIDGSSPVNILGYNIYRRSEKGSYAEPLNSKPVTESSFDDTSFKFGREYTYLVRAVSQSSDGLIESEDSSELTVTPKDTFPPERPTNLTGAAAAGIVSIFWPSVKSRDLKGYMVYRTEQQDASRDSWVRLTPDPIIATTFRDTSALTGKTYYYLVTSLDETGNESAPSEAVEVEVLQ